MSRRVTSAPVEHLSRIGPQKRVTSAPVEHLSRIGPQKRATSTPVEHLSRIGPQKRVTSTPVEHVSPLQTALPVDGLRHAHTLAPTEQLSLAVSSLAHPHTLASTGRVLRIVSNLLHGHTIAGGALRGGPGRATQLAAEVSVDFGGHETRASQLTIELLRDAGNLDEPPLVARPSQATLEVVRDTELTGRTTQLLLELLTSHAPLPVAGPIEGFYFGRRGGNDILRFGQINRDDPD